MNVKTSAAAPSATNRYNAPAYPFDIYGTRHYALAKGQRAALGASGIVSLLEADERVREIRAVTSEPNEEIESLSPCTRGHLIMALETCLDAIGGYFEHEGDRILAAGDIAEDRMP